MSMYVYELIHTGIQKPIHIEVPKLNETVTYELSYYLIIILLF